jgi:hypothetical protein
VAINLSVAWDLAEQTAFEKLASYLQSKPNVDCFRGYLPIDRECWMFTSGGLATGPIARWWNDTPLFGTLSFKARVAAQYLDRSQCLIFASKILAFLSETSNMKQTGNVMWLRLADMPGEPTFGDEFVETDDGIVSVVLWKIEVPLELVFHTADEN